MSSNPFRHSPPLPPLPPSSPPVPPTQLDMPSSHSNQQDSDILSDDIPPPYTPAATVGEETVGLGPRRPFQQPPLLPPSSLDQRPYFSGPPLRVTGPELYPQPEPWGPAPWQTRQQYRQRKTGGGLIGAIIDTVRDIADAVSGAYDERTMATQSAYAGAYANPYPTGINTHPVYAPPPGPPPPPRPASAPPLSPPPVPDDGTPTRTPVPGHPLLLHGNLLVYPKDHLCVKCKNTGYKNYDPSSPCRKCWDKYGRPFAGALTYTPWSSSGNDPRMQRPLPKFVPPHLAGSNAGPSQSPYGLYPSPLQHLQHSRSISQPHGSGSANPGPSYYVMNPLCPRDVPPVPHAIPVDPGDPRLGGQLCRRCDGTGVQTMMLLDVTTCDNCGGTGRVWR